MTTWETLIKEMLGDVVGRRKLGVFLATEGDAQMLAEVERIVRTAEPAIVDDVLRYKTKAGITDPLTDFDLRTLVDILPDFSHVAPEPGTTEAPSLNI